jgi:dihydrofolate synthase / folylpolyglutamate synthase
MADKDARGLLTVFDEIMNQVVVTQVASTTRGMPAAELGEIAAGIFGADRVHVAPRLDDAIETAVGLAETDGAGAPGVLVTGSVVLVGEARTLLVAADESPARPVTDDPDDDWDADYADDGEQPDRDLWS